MVKPRFLNITTKVINYKGLDIILYNMKKDKKLICLGIEGSANKIGIGIVDSEGSILSNPRKTFITPPGQGFRPKETADYHRIQVLSILRQALDIAKISLKDVGLFCYTKGPGMAQPLSVGALVVRTLSQMYNKPIVGVNHCVGHIEMGRLVMIKGLQPYHIICIRRKHSGNCICRQ